VPTVGGEIAFDKRYSKNPLVNAFALGVVNINEIFTAKASGVGNPVIYIGAKTGKDGIHGATMASEEFSSSSESKRPNTQIGDPFKEKLLLEACLELMKTASIVGIQDMGAAGLTSSSFEMASHAGSGVRLELDKVPMRESGLTPYEIMLSESQERMLLVGRKGLEKKIESIVNKWDLDAAIIGEVTDDGFVTLCWHGEVVARLQASPLSDSAPMYDRLYSRPEWLNKLSVLSDTPMPKDFNSIFYRLIGSPTIASKRYVYEQYDHMVQGATVILPGSDTALVRLTDSAKGIAMSADCIGRYCYLDPRSGAAYAVAESCRNIAASGAVPIALTNCLNYGNPEKPEVMYQLVEGIEGLAEAAKELSTPVVSGNVSLYNETEGEAIYPTPTIVAVGVIDSVGNAVTSYFKKIGSTVIAIGKIPDKIDASHYLEFIHGKVEGVLPDVDYKFHRRLIKFMSEAAKNGEILSAHDVSDGGLAVALFEMGCLGNIGANIAVKGAVRADAILFGEGQLMLIEADGDRVLERLKKSSLEYSIIGVTAKDTLYVSINGHRVLDINMEKACIIYEKSLPEALL
jgi:phosphoribosylformylglycinamidine synthase